MLDLEALTLCSSDGGHRILVKDLKLELEPVSLFLLLVVEQSLRISNRTRTCRLSAVVACPLI